MCIRDRAGKAAKNTSSKIRTKNTVAKAVKGKPQKAVKTASRSVKGVKQSARGIKTAQRSAKTAQKTTKATARATKAAVHTAKAAAKAAITGIKAAARATAAAVKAAAAAVKSLIAAIAAGGWVAILIIPVSYTHLDVYKRQFHGRSAGPAARYQGYGFLCGRYGYDWN